MKYLAIILLLALPGCGAIEDKFNELGDAIEDSVYNNLLSDLWNGNHRERSDEFIINYPVDLGLTSPILDDVENLWEDLEACTGFDVDISHAPLIISYLAVNDLTNSSFGGFIWLDINYAEIVIADLYDTNNWVKYNITENMMLRYMLYQTGSTIEEIGNETSPYFDECLTLGTTAQSTKRGER